HQHIAPQAELALLRAGSVGNNLTLQNAVALTDDRFLIDAGVLVGPLEFDELVDVGPDLTRQLRGVVLTFDTDDDALGVDGIDNAIALGEDDGAGVAGGDAFHAGADQGRLRDEQRHGLALHVCAHECAVGVVVLEEGNQRGGDGDQLLGADVDVVDFAAVDEDEVALAARIDELFDDVAVLVELDVGLSDGVLVFFPRGEIEGVGLELNLTLLFFAQLLVEFEGLRLLEVIADAQAAFAGVGDLDEVEHAAFAHLAVGRLNEPVLIDTREAGERADEADVRTFRRLDRTDTAVVSGVNVADFESGALARQTARPKRGEAALVRDFRERVGLIHELRELRGTEELADSRHDRLGVDEVVRHGRGHFLVHGHFFFNGAFHADQADT